MTKLQVEYMSCTVVMLNGKSTIPYLVHQYVDPKMISTGKSYYCMVQEVQ